ncbi:hypothetical protein L873DRAFT_1789028 [Choiromyces venosus 120613-1]|uniref:Uncharacterized protein n=1 Tax=Choiromyces venosus 120613-1 TaxID=1336337 RepID=A0A3N4JQ72_9PEZI|nr:hypothetical protein L873DRAFT_1789028 [Choiromyces venosus 120613-1]
MNVLDLKATEYPLASKHISTYNKANQIFTRVYLQDTRFNAHKAAILEERFLAKVRKVNEAKCQDDLNKVGIEQKYWEKLVRQAEEVAGRALEIASQHVMERQKCELEMGEQEQRATEAARLKAETERAEKEKRHERKRRKKQFPQGRRMRRKLEEAPSPRQPTSCVGLEAYSRKSTTNDRAAMERAIAALHELHHTVRLKEAFTKAKKLTIIHHRSRHRFGQLNGERAPTIEVRDFLKNTFVDLWQYQNWPTVPGNTFFLTQDPSYDVPVLIAFIWTIYELAKLLVKQIIKECAMKAGTADPV